MIYFICQRKEKKVIKLKWFVRMTTNFIHSKNNRKWAKTEAIWEVNYQYFFIIIILWQLYFKYCWTQNSNIILCDMKLYSSFQENQSVSKVCEAFVIFQISKFHFYICVCYCDSQRYETYRNQNPQNHMCIWKFQFSICLRNILIRNGCKFEEWSSYKKKNYINRCWW